MPTLSQRSITLLRRQLGVVVIPPGGGGEGGEPGAGPGAGATVSGSVGLSRVAGSNTLVARKTLVGLEPVVFRENASGLAATIECEGGTSDQSVRLAWYTNVDNGSTDEFGTLIAIGAELTVTAGASRQVRTLPVPSTLTFAAGQRVRPVLWLGDAVNGSSTGMIIYLEEDLGTRVDVFVNTYSSTGNPASPFPSYTSTNEKGGFPRLLVTYQTTMPGAAVAGTFRLSPVEVGLGTQVSNRLAGPHLWRSEGAHVPLVNNARYQRYFWNELENNAGTAYTLDELVNDAKAARDAGLMFGFRVRGQESGSIFQVPTFLGSTGSTFWNSTTVQTRFQALLQAIYNRLNAEGLLPWIIWIEGGPGSYGEWTNWSSTSASRTFYANVMADVFAPAGIPFVMHLADSASAAIALARTTAPLVGLRGDIWGDPAGSSQVTRLSPATIRRYVRRAAEEGRIFIGEPTPHDRAFMVTFLNQARVLGLHSVGNGNWNATNDYNLSAMSAQEMQDMNDAYRLMGYRLAAWAIDVPTAVVNGVGQTWRSWWYNRGWSWAPGIGTWSVEVRLRNGATTYTAPLTLTPRTIAPGRATPQEFAQVITWSGVAAGSYQLDIRISNSRLGHIALASGTSVGSGWYQQNPAGTSVTVS